MCNCNNSKLLNRRQAAAALSDAGYQITYSTLATLATRGRGPAYQLFRGKAVYSPATLFQWAEGQLSYPKNTSSFA